MKTFETYNGHEWVSERYGDGEEIAVAVYFLGFDKAKQVATVDIRCGDTEESKDATIELMQRINTEATCNHPVEAVLAMRRIAREVAIDRGICVQFACEVSELGQ